MNVTERFLKYAAFDTRSDEASTQIPSSPGQRILAQELAKELTQIGLDQVLLDANCCLTATLPANTEQKVPTIGFLAHLDTSPDMPGKNVRPRIVRYLGEDIVLNRTAGIVLSPGMFPELDRYRGQEIIVTDGLTLLGADDKAGIAAIVSAMEYLIKHPHIRHGKIRLAFTPDEEIGRGTDHFNVAGFGCDWAYTVDGGPIGELEYENFHAATARIMLKGLNVHPGEAKNKLRNASLLAAEFISLLPTAQRPEHTEGKEGFFHLVRMDGTVEEASLQYLIRDHSRKLFEEKKKLLETLVQRINSRHPGCASMEMHDQYHNMREVIEPRQEIIRLAMDAMKDAGVEPVIKPIRGGTDGARLSFVGLPCPNLFAGGHNFHGRYEFLPVQALTKSMETIVKIVQLLALSPLSYR